MTTMTITKKQLEAALLTWELAYRAGETRTVEEGLAMSPEQVAAESSSHLWRLLETNFPQFCTPSKSEQQIVDECNELAVHFLLMEGFEVPDGHKCYLQGHCRDEFAWALATAAYDHIEGTDVQDVLDSLEDEDAQ